MTSPSEFLQISLMDAVSARAALSWWYTAIVVVLIAADRPKRRAHGVVFDASTLRPLSYAIVALLRPNGAVTRTAVTDENGRYRIMAPEGYYRLYVTRSGYLSVSPRFNKRKSIGSYQGLYGGETIGVRQSDPLIAPDIPLEPKNPGPRMGAELADVLWRRIGAYAKALLPLLTVLWSLKAPGPQATAALMIEAAAYVACGFRWLPARRRWGVVRNTRTGQPVPYAKVELIDAATAQLIDSSATDPSGRYNFLAANFRRMYIRCRRPGYRSFRSDTLRFFGFRFEKTDLVGIDIALQPDPAASPKQRGEVVSILEIPREEFEAARQAMLSGKKGGTDVNVS